MAHQFENQVVLITGAGNGIGRATALAFAREGARVIAADIADGDGESVVAEIRNAGGDARFVHANVAFEKDVEALVQGTIQAYGRLDIAFNNAGIEGALAPVAEQSEEDWQGVLGVNLTGVFHCMKQELSEMVKQGSGAIVNNASILGHVAFPNASAYTAAKHGILGLTRCAAIEYAPKGIRVNAVCPGLVLTPMLEHAGPLADASAHEDIKSLHAFKRLGDPEEVAEAVLFLASRLGGPSLPKVDEGGSGVVASV